jgi:hypothetical protein
MKNPETLATLAHKTQDEDILETLATLGTQDTGRRQSIDTGNIGHTRHRTKTNKTIKHNTATLGTQDTGGRQTKQ